LNNNSSSAVEELDDPELERFIQRLKEDLGLDEDAIEVVINLRNQVKGLQARVHTLETSMQFYEEHSGLRITRYRQVIVEAEWKEAPETDKE